MSVIHDPEALYDMLGRAGEKRLISPSEVIFERGDRANSMFVLVSGTVDFKRGDEVFHSLQRTRALWRAGADRSRRTVDDGGGAD